MSISCTYPKANSTAETGDLIQTAELNQLVYFNKNLTLFFLREYFILSIKFIHPIEFYLSSYVSVLAVGFGESMVLFLDTNYIKPIYTWLLIALQIKLSNLQSNLDLCQPRFPLMSTAKWHHS